MCVATPAGFDYAAAVNRAGASGGDKYVETPGGTLPGAGGHFDPNSTARWSLRRWWAGRCHCRSGLLWRYLAGKQPRRGRGHHADGSRLIVSQPRSRPNANDPACAWAFEGVRQMRRHSSTRFARAGFLDTFGRLLAFESATDTRIEDAVSGSLPASRRVVMRRSSNTPAVRSARCRRDVRARIASQRARGRCGSAG